VIPLREAPLETVVEKLRRRGRRMRLSGHAKSVSGRNRG
jgi:hypothetical protein